MSYSSGMLRKKVGILTRKETTEWGETTEYELRCTVWAALDWNRGVKAMREGALDAYDTVMIRMRWNPIVDRHCRLKCDGVTYQIQSLHADRHENTIQITATEII